MKWMAAAGLCLIAGLIIWGEYKAAKEQRSRLAILVITASAFVLAVTLLINPELPGPTEFMNLMFDGLSKRFGLQ
ncbi:hypothetical protein PAECIP111893_04518 [Paenibacillus plantiphilus]|uniref:Uncharacterized protein n=1 Tax=Paenibacillus plantiphilus TaxID=2905650 RepID=A0ABM9CP61_9BACL|nr:hypothetical protein [Paenibacillus plantiphilus]CAH1219213.1 hypothetical protein PAECIP111893_04518 [Paenibacillus plantiphilus]